MRPPIATSPSASGARGPTARTRSGRSSRRRRLANGSDAPIEELDPLAGIRAGVRRTIDERPPWRPQEALTVDEAFEATCVAPAWLAHDERRRGKLLPGYEADLVVLDRDPWDDLEAQVVATMVGGRGSTTRHRGSAPGLALSQNEVCAAGILRRGLNDNVTAAAYGLWGT